MHLRKPSGQRLVGLRATLTLVLAWCIGLPQANATSMAELSIVDLIRYSDQIVVGTVLDVSDGFNEKGIPFTEVTISVSSTVRGENFGAITFRQFGLAQPRQINGRTYLGSRPEGFPEWSANESVMLFLSPPAKLTGLRTTVGLGQGKLRMRDGKLMSGTGNRGLFQNVQVSAANLSQEQRDMLLSRDEAVDGRTFISLVRQAVEENWVESGVMRNEN